MNITPFKNRLENDHKFDNFDTIKGLGGKCVSTHDTGSVVLVDPKHTLKDVLYVPENSGSIVSLIDETQKIRLRFPIFGRP